MKKISSIIALALLAIFAVFLFSQDKSTKPVKESKTSLDVQNVQPSIGDPKAQVLIEYYYDYQCKWCKDFDLNTLPKLEKYFRSKQAQFVFKDLVFLGPDSQKAALASECVFQNYGNDKFLKFHQALYEAQKTKNTGWVSSSLLRDISVNNSINYPELDTCIVSKKYLGQISHDTESAKNLGLTSTPSFVIDGKKLSGSQPIEVFEQIIENTNVIN